MFFLCVFYVPRHCNETVLNLSTFCVILFFCTFPFYLSFVGEEIENYESVKIGLTLRKVWDTALCLLRFLSLICWELNYFEIIHKAIRFGTKLKLYQWQIHS